MKDTIKNSIIGAFAIFGFVALISSSNTAPTVIQDGKPESHVWEVITYKESSVLDGIVMYNKATGELRKCRTLTLNSKTLDSQYYVTYSDKTIK
tara:strand:- start:2078 stop:2359 length:282 start_codon:yes stop_codon:yes gene_type:complete